MAVEYATRAAKAKIEIYSGQDILEDGQRIARYLWNQLWWELVGWYRKKMMRPRGDLQLMADYEGKDSKRKHDRKWYGQHMAECREAGGTMGSLKDKLPKYPGKDTLDKEMRDFWAFQDLADRCASYTVREFDANMRSWFSNLKTDSHARPPGPCRTVRPSSDCQRQSFSESRTLGLYQVTHAAGDQDCSSAADSGTTRMRAGHRDVPR